MMEEGKDEMAEEVTSFLKLPVYTRDGIYVGHVRNVFLDLDENKVSSLLVTNTNPTLVEGTVDVAIPYRWVNSIGDIVILAHFPQRITTTKTHERDEDSSSDDIDVIQ
jgi:sporulation protein YlmC with PRC-barrel domain